MGEREQFLKEYQEQVLDTLTLPPEWSVRYTVHSCRKMGSGRCICFGIRPAGRRC